MKCEYYGNNLDYEIRQYPGCGAFCKYISRPQKPEKSAHPDVFFALARLFISPAGCISNPAE